jgi:hypothetical protein
VECKTTGRSRHLADDGRHFTDRAVRFAGIVVGIVNAAPVVIFSVAQHCVPADSSVSPDAQDSGEGSQRWPQVRRRVTVLNQIQPNVHRWALHSVRAKHGRLRSATELALSPGRRPGA